MPVGEQAAGGSLGTIFYPARLTARFACGQLRHLFSGSLHGRGLLTYRGSPLVQCSPHRFGTNLVTPGETFLLRLEAGEIAAAGRATPRSSAEAQQKPRPAGWVIAMGCPFGQLLAVAAGAARISPGAIGPDAGFPAAAAAPATQRRNSQKTLEALHQSLGSGKSRVSRPTMWTS